MSSSRNVIGIQPDTSQPMEGDSGYVLNTIILDRIRNMLGKFGLAIKAILPSASDEEDLEKILAKRVTEEGTNPKDVQKRTDELLSHLVANGGNLPPQTVNNRY